MSDDWLPVWESPDWVNYILTDLALTASLGALVSYLVVVFPDPEPLISLPNVVTLPPVLWLWVALSIIWLPLLQWYHVGERVTIWWEEHVE